MKLNNDTFRKAFLDTWEKWPVYVSVPELNAVHKHYMLPNGARIVASTYRPLTVCGYEVPHSASYYIMQPDDGMRWLPYGESLTSLLTYLKQFPEV